MGYTFLIQHFCTGSRSFYQACGSVGMSADLGRVSGGTSRVRDPSCQVSNFDQYRLPLLSSTIMSLLFYTVYWFSTLATARGVELNTETLLYLIYLRIYYSISVNRRPRSMLATHKTVSTILNGGGGGG